MSGFSLCNLTSLFPFSFPPFSSQKSFLSTFSCSINTSFSSSSLPKSIHTHLSFRPFPGKRNDGFCSFAVEKKRNGGFELMKMDALGNDDEEENDDEWNGFDFDGVVDDDEEMVLPFEKMRKWLENKPRGFGEGKVYDTSLEDKLLDEIEQSRQAQAANLNKLNNSPVVANAFKKDEKKRKVLEGTQSGIQVRVTNLPKKKNVHRDLKSAFEGVPGIINITPAVSGSKKTKDPVCKGFAYVDFKSEVHATRFVESFSGQKIFFGKVERQIKCQVMDSLSQKTHQEERSGNFSDERKSTHEEESSGNSSEEHEPLFDSEEDLSADFVVEGTFSDSWEESNKPVYNSDGELDEVKVEDKQYNFSCFSVETSKEMRHECETDSKSPKQLDEIWAIENNKLLAKDEASGVDESQAECEFDEDEYYSDDELDTVTTEDVGEDPKSFGAERVRLVDSIRPKPDSADDLNSSDPLVRIRALERRLLARGKLWEEAEARESGRKHDRERKKNNKRKKVLAKVQKKNASRLEIPGSAKRLKVKEKAILTGVLSKYAAKAATSTSKEERLP